VFHSPNISKVNASRTSVADGLVCVIVTVPVAGLECELSLAALAAVTPVLNAAQFRHVA